MEINGTTRLCGLIGNPVEHTVSPQIHNTLAEKMGINLAYLPFYVEKGRLEDAVRGAEALYALGVNVTIPYKTDVIAYLQEIDPMAEVMGSVNTLVRTDGGWKGYNTDLNGLFRAMQEDGAALEGEKVLILGAGGVARTAAFLCAQKDASFVYILNRSVERAQALAQEVEEKTGYSHIRAMALSEWDRLPRERFLAIQCSSVGLYPDQDAAIIEEAAFYDRIHTGYDLIYRPAVTKFMQMVENAGGKAYNGLKMLLYQGIEAFEKWNEVTVPDELASEVYEVIRSISYKKK